MKDSQARKTWRCMIVRCHDPSSHAYHRYGARGITVCDRWRVSFDSFVSDMGPRPSPKHELDRIDNNDGYYPDNCRWVTRSQNCRNRRSSRFIDVHGTTWNLSDLAESVGLPDRTLSRRIDAGWPIDDALTRPLRMVGPYGTGEKAIRKLRKLQKQQAIIADPSSPPTFIAYLPEDK